MESWENNSKFNAVILNLQLKESTDQRDYASKSSYFCGKIINQEENLF